MEMPTVLLCIEHALTAQHVQAIKMLHLVGGKMALTIAVYVVYAAKEVVGHKKTSESGGVVIDCLWDGTC